MIKYNHWVLYYLLLVIINACTITNEKKETILKDEISSHYVSDSDSLKLKAALFLCENVKNYGSWEGSLHDKFVDELKHIHWQKPRDVLRILKKSHYNNYKNEFIPDITKINSDEIIQTVDYAFASGHTFLWQSQINWGNFCEYVLPYRVDTEPLKNWRKEVLSDSLILYNNLLKHGKDIETTAYQLLKALSNTKKDFLVAWQAPLNIPPISYETLKLLNVGTCIDLTRLSIFVLRAHGIAVAHDMVPIWGNRNGGHHWNALILKEKSIPFIIPIKDTLGVYKDNSDLITKVYRKQFSVNNQSHVKLKGYCRYLPAFLNNPMLTDVTCEYAPTYNVSITPNIAVKSHAYLSVSQKFNWSPVGWGENNGSLIIYSNVTTGVVYLPVVIDPKESTPISHPFSLNSDGQTHFYTPDKKNRQSLKLFRKHPLDREIEKSLTSMIGGQFQVSNDKNFVSYKSVYSIDANPTDYPNEIKFELAKKYRYIRYLAPDSSRCYIAELKCYSSKGEFINGHILGVFESQPLEYAFDNDVLTYYYKWTQAPDVWIGIDFGKPVDIGGLIFSPRNDKNYIVVGDIYELFYWDNKWVSLGKQVATCNYLTYNNAPSNCIFILRNYTEGIEERIFTYENGKQVWR